MKRPAFQFYPGDWLRNANLRRCSHAARGAWMDVLCVLHDSDEYGLIRWPLADIANACAAPVRLLRELVDKGVLKGCDKGQCTPFVYTPRSGRKDGDPVTLVVQQDGPIWYSSRMVKDEYVRTIRGESSRFSEAPDSTPKKAPKAAPKPPFGDGSSSASATAVEETPQPPKGRTGAVTLKTWAESLKAKGEKLIPPDDPVFAYAEKVGLPSEFLELAWPAFRHRYTVQHPAKRYADWRRVFRNSVEGNWLKLWFVQPDGTYALTTVGIQAQRAGKDAA